MKNPYTYSGGRTSGFMLRQILNAFGGQLPSDLYVLFCNTGKERNETLDFVERSSQQWDVPIVWLEYRDRDGEHSFEVTNYASASRAGEPFDQLLDHLAEFRRVEKGMPPVLPNPVQRFCTAELKVRTMRRYLQSKGLGKRGYSNAVGLRFDEQKRVHRILGNDVEAGYPVCPMHAAKHTLADVMEFWKAQPFDLQLEQHEGNCDLCFLKSASKISDIISRRPDLAKWWIDQEAATGQRFRRDRPSYAVLASSPRFDFGDEGLETCHCTD